MIFAEFQHLGCSVDGKPPRMIPLLGSDGVLICDGRKTLRNQIEDAQQRIKQLQSIHPDITGLIMYQSPRLFSEGVAVTRFLPKEQR